MDCRILGDWFHIISFVALILQIKKTRHLKGDFFDFWKKKKYFHFLGISYKTQEIYLAVFVTRYLDTFVEWYSWYNLILRIAFIGLTIYLIYEMRFKRPLCLVFFVLYFLINSNFFFFRLMIAKMMPLIIDSIFIFLV